MQVLHKAAWCVLAATLVCAPADRASALYKQGLRAERAGDVVGAYLLYSQAAGLDPNNTAYWLRSHALRTRAALKARPRPASPAPSAGTAEAAETSPEAPPAPDPVTTEDLAEVSRLQPPPQIRASAERKSFDLRGDARALFEEVARAYGLDVVFDGEYEPGPPRRFRIEDAGYREALRALEAATSSFLVPLGERLLMVVKDTPQKRSEVEPTVAVAIPIPHPVAIQEAQELARTIQQAMEIQKFGVDSQRRVVVMRDRLSKVRPAQALFEQMLQHRGEVLVELEFLEVSRSALVSYGLALPKEFPMAYLGRLAQNLLLSIPPGFSRFGVFGGGKTLFGIGLSDAELVARLTRSAGRNLLRAQVRSMDGQPATFNVGEQYPIVTNGYFGPIQNPGLPVFTPPPAFNYENLGLSMKFTPRIHSSREVTLELEAEFKLLAGQAINGIPVLSTRKLQTKIRLENGEYGMVAGLMNASEARTISGLAGLSNIPVLGHLTRKTDHNDTGTELLIMIRPRLLAPAPESATSRPLFLGSESRWMTPL